MKPKPTPEQLAWIAQCEQIRAVDIRDLGLPTEDSIDIRYVDDLLDLYEGIDGEGCAL